MKPVVVYVAHEFPARSQTFVVAEADALEHAGFDVRIYALRPGRGAAASKPSADMETGDPSADPRTATGSRAPAGGEPAVHSSAVLPAAADTATAVEVRQGNHARSGAGGGNHRRRAAGPSPGPLLRVDVGGRPPDPRLAAGRHNSVDRGPCRRRDPTGIRYPADLGVRVCGLCHLREPVRQGRARPPRRQRPGRGGAMRRPGPRCSVPRCFGSSRREQGRPAGDVGRSARREEGPRRLRASLPRDHRPNSGISSPGRSSVTGRSVPPWKRWCQISACNGRSSSSGKGRTTWSSRCSRRRATCSSSRRS